MQEPESMLQDRIYSFLIPIVLTVLALMGPLKADAQSTLNDLGVYGLHEAPDDDLKNSFVLPNERDPSLMKDIINESPGGVYVAVGTERGFIGASLANQITSLLLVDSDPRVMVYNRVNIALLKLAKDRKDYLYLRFRSSHQEWLWRAEQNQKLLADEVLVLSKPKNFIFFKKAISFRSWFFYDNALPRKENGKDFKQANYLVYDNQFLKLKQFADAQQIRFVQLNLNEAAGVDQLVQHLQRLQFKISVLDISNAWWGQYISQESLDHLIRRFAEVATKESLLLVTEQSYDRPISSRWDYYAFKIKEMAAQGSVSVFKSIKNFKAQTVNQVDSFKKCSQLFR